MRNTSDAPQEQSTPFLDFYYEQMAHPEFPCTGMPVMTYAGLCRSFKDMHSSDLNYKVAPEFKTFITVYVDNDILGYWEQPQLFGALRQTVVLLCAAIDGELDEIA